MIPTLETLRERIARHGNLSALAVKANVPRTTISSIVNENAEPRLETARAILCALEEVDAAMSELKQSAEDALAEARK
jgi:DNA-binding phage protein